MTSFFILLTAALLGAACDTRAATTAEGRQRLTQALTRARAACSFRVRGQLRNDGATLVEWEGFVDGADEQYLIRTNGLLIESRRFDRSSWARRVEPPGTWERVPYDGALILQSCITARSNASSATTPGQ